MTYSSKSFGFFAIQQLLDNMEKIDQKIPESEEDDGNHGVHEQ
jgi:hypothetical protein